MTRYAGVLGRLVLGLLVVAGSSAVVMRLVPALQGTSRYLAQAASFIPFAVLGWLAALALAAVLTQGRRRGLALLCCAALAVQISWLAPFFISDDAPRTPGRELRITSLNVMFGQADAAQVVREAGGADVLVLVELTGDGLDRLRHAGIEAEFPYRAGRTGPGADGSMVLSRWPLREVDLPAATMFEQAAAVVEVPGTAGVAVVAAHPVNPMFDVADWVRDAEATVQNLQFLQQRQPESPLVVAGDFNATPDHLTLRRITSQAGLRNAADLAGAGWVLTWPEQFRLWGVPLPTLIPIDHVLVGPTVHASDVSSFTVDDSDHRGLHATLRVPGASG